MPSPIGAMPLQGVQSHIVFKISVPAQLEPLLTPPHLLDDPQALNGFLSNIRGGGGPQGLSVFGGEAQFRKPVKNTQNIPQGLHCSEADKDGFFIPVDNDFVLNIAGDQIPLKYGDIIDRVEGQIVRVRFTSDREVILKNGIKIQCSHKLPLEIDTYGVKKFTTAHAVSLSLSEDIGAEIAPDYVVEMNAARLVNKFWMASSRSEHKDCFMDVLGFRVVVDGAGFEGNSFYFCIKGGCQYPAGKGVLDLQAGDLLKVDKEFNITSVKSGRPQNIEYPNGMVLGLYSTTEASQFIKWRGYDVPKYAVLTERFEIPSELSYFEPGVKVYFSTDGACVFTCSSNKAVVYGETITKLTDIRLSKDNQLSQINYKL